MKRLLLIFAFGLIVFSCGSRKRALEKKSETKTETVNETVIVEESVESETPKIAEPVINSITQYISVYKDIAMEEMRAYKIPASITLAQGILESGSGKGTLATKAIIILGLNVMIGKAKRFIMMMIKGKSASENTRHLKHLLEIILSF